MARVDHASHMAAKMIRVVVVVPVGPAVHVRVVRAVVILAAPVARVVVVPAGTRVVTNAALAAAQAKAHAPRVLMAIPATPRASRPTTPIRAASILTATSPATRVRVALLHVPRAHARVASPEGVPAVLRVRVAHHGLVVRAVVGVPVVGAADHKTAIADAILLQMQKGADGALHFFSVSYRSGADAGQIDRTARKLPFDRGHLGSQANITLLNKNGPNNRPALTTTVNCSREGRLTLSRCEHFHYCPTQ